MYKFRVEIIAILLVCALIYISYGIIVSRKISISKYEIESSKIPKEFDGFKIVQISDLHNKNKVEEICKKVKELKPDILVITGDMVNYDTKKTDNIYIIDIIGKMDKNLPIYYVKGNHEQILEYYDVLKGKDNYKEIEKKIIDLETTPLSNRKISIKKGDNEINLYGLNVHLDQYVKFHNQTQPDDFTKDEIYQLVKEIDKNEYNILLSHTPNFFDEYEKAGFDLVFSGHVHGGEINIPGVGGVLSPDRTLFPKYDKGIYTINSSKLVLSAGLGDKTFDFRMYNPFDLVLVELKTK